MSEKPSEFEAMEKCWELLSALDADARHRVASWLGQKLQQAQEDPRLMAQQAIGMNNISQASRAGRFP